MLDQEFAFVGRKRELCQLEAAFRQRRHVIVSGCAGSGKSALLTQLRARHPLLICERTSRIDQSCNELARDLGLRACTSAIDMLEAQVISNIKQGNTTVVFDNFDDASPSVTSLIERLICAVPVWIVTRKMPAEGLGRIGNQFNEFAHLEVPPLRKKELRILLEKVTTRGIVSSSPLEHLEDIHRFCRGNLRLLENLLREVCVNRVEWNVAIRRALDSSATS